MEVRFLGALAVSLALLLGSLALFNSLSVSQREDRIATDALLLWQLERIASKYVPETLSYAYFKELNESFPTRLYRNQPNERWSVPYWFSYPQGGTTAECDGLGCTIWNLSGGSSTEDPCPDVVSYTPSPPVQTSSIIVSDSSLRNRLSDVFGEINTLLSVGSPDGTLYGLSTFGRSIGISYSIESLLHVLTTYHLIDRANIRVGDTIPYSGNIFLERNLFNGAYLRLNLKPVYSKAYCICKDPNNNDVVIAEYNVEIYYVEVNAFSEDLNELLVEDNFPYLKYFIKKTRELLPNGTSYHDCVMTLR